VDSTEQVLTKLAIRDEAFIQSILSGEERASIALSCLGAKTHALVRVAALIALEATAPSYMWAIESACEAGATEEEIVGCLVAVMPAVGVPRVVSAAPKLGLVLGYDVGAALEDSTPVN
jgi:alkylhydroperoxidase/carboxymuconolactone decarboxylase family protein YurZ